MENAQPRKRKLDDASEVDEAARKTSSTNASSVSVQSPPTAQRKAPAPTKQPSPKKPFAVDETLSLQRHRHCKYLGHTTTLEGSLIALGSFNNRSETESQIGTLRRVAGSEYFSTHADADIPIPDDEAQALAEIEQTVSGHGPALIDIYFHKVHPSYPVIQKKAFLDRHRQGDHQFNPPLLAAMYLLALRWWDHEPAVRGYPKPDMARLEYIAITGLNIAVQRPKISAVQAGLLLLQHAKSHTWVLTVQLVALGQDIGLHLDCTDWTIPQWERRLRKRLAWALYMQDKWSALMHGRPSHINAADWNVDELTEGDFDETILPLSPPDEDEDGALARGRIIFMQMITLTGIMAEVCATFYSEAAKAEWARAGRRATQLVLNKAKPVQIKLKEWFARLPAECKMDSPDALGYLHLAYFATEISIHRRIVQSLESSVEVDSYMLYICRSAAKTRLISALDFANRLQPSQLDAFWMFASASNFALIGTFGALLQASSPAREEADFYACRLNEFRWTLTVSAQRATWIYGALEILNANVAMLQGLPEKPYAKDIVMEDIRPVDSAAPSLDSRAGSK